jgi:hypothetical protein
LSGQRSYNTQILYETTAGSAWPFLTSRGGGKPHPNVLAEKAVASPFVQSSSSYSDLPRIPLPSGIMAAASLLQSAASTPSLDLPASPAVPPSVPPAAPPLSFHGLFNAGKGTEESVQADIYKALVTGDKSFAGSALDPMLRAWDGDDDDIQRQIDIDHMGMSLRITSGRVALFGPPSRPLPQMRTPL